MNSNKVSPSKIDVKIVNGPNGARSSSPGKKSAGKNSGKGGKDKEKKKGFIRGLFTRNSR